MDSYIEQYQAAYGEVTLHIGTEGAGRQPAHYYITGVPGTAVPAWFRKVLHQKHLRDIVRFPYCPSGETPKRSVTYERHTIGEKRARRYREARPSGAALAALPSTVSPSPPLSACYEACVDAQREMRVLG